jgi:hypothetical protein
MRPTLDLEVKKVEHDLCDEITAATKKPIDDLHIEIVGACLVKSSQSVFTLV